MGRMSFLSGFCRGLSYVCSFVAGGVIGLRGSDAGVEPIVWLIGCAVLAAMSVAIKAHTVSKGAT